MVLVFPSVCYGYCNGESGWMVMSFPSLVIFFRRSVRSDFQSVKTQVVFFCEKSPPLAVARHS